MKKTFATIALTFWSVAPALGQDLNFSDIHTEACLQEAVGAGETYNCIGASANQCMRETVGGQSSVGMGGCLDRERQYWDDRLNATYLLLISQQANQDLPLNDRLRDMQRAWIGYRDTRCDYEYAQWGGGTGGGPALVACLMQATAEQVLVLEQNLR